MEVDGEGTGIVAPLEAEQEDADGDGWEYAAPMDILPGLAKASIKVGAA